MMTAPRMKSSLGEQFRHLPITEPPLLAGNGRRASTTTGWRTHRDSTGTRWPATTAYDRIQVPASMVGGWYDVFLKGTLENFLRMRETGGSERAGRHSGC